MLAKSWCSAFTHLTFGNLVALACGCAKRKMRKEAMKALENLMIQELSQIRQSASSLEGKIGKLEDATGEQVTTFVDSLIALERKTRRLERLLDAMAA
jgi:hypothetical protein